LVWRKRAPETVRSEIYRETGGRLDILINNAGLSSKPDPIAPDDV
jgi:NADP-dependent 3-hydroxy acid dehydrogenase YdfG